MKISLVGETHSLWSHPQGNSWPLHHPKGPRQTRLCPSEWTCDLSPKLKYMSVTKTPLGNPGLKQYKDSNFLTCFHFNIRVSFFFYSFFHSTVLWCLKASRNSKEMQHKIWKAIPPISWRVVELRSMWHLTVYKALHWPFQGFRLQRRWSWGTWCGKEGRCLEDTETAVRDALRSETPGLHTSLCHWQTLTVRFPRSVDDSDSPSTAAEGKKWKE